MVRFEKGSLGDLKLWFITRKYYGHIIRFGPKIGPFIRWQIRLYDRQAERAVFVKSWGSQ